MAVREASSLEKSWQNATHTVFGNECGPIMRIAVQQLLLWVIGFDHGVSRIYKLEEQSFSPSSMLGVRCWKFDVRFFALFEFCCFLFQLLRPVERTISNATQSLAI